MSFNLPQIAMTYPEAVQFLYSLGNEVQTAKLGLERISKILAALDNPERACRSVHIAGTNGKGSTAAMIESGLRAAGMRTGLYTSPHLSEPVERLQINGKPVTREQFAAAFATVHETAERMLETGGIDLHSTYFETVTAMAFVLFREAKLDMVVLETGLGGRLDATNVVTPELCVITPIDLDHQNFLGSTIERIAAEKAGILKPGVPAIFSAQCPEAAAVLRAYAQGPYRFASDCRIEDLQIDARGSRFRLAGMRIECPLAGEHQVENARTAALALQQLDAGCRGIAGMANARWPGRLERVAENPEIILDGAHNPAGARALGNYIQRFYGSRRIWLVYGAMRDKAVDEITPILFPLAGRIILTAANTPRALAPEQIHASGATITHSVAEAVALARQAGPEDAVFITGSLFVVGEARELLV